MKTMLLAAAAVAIAMAEGAPALSEVEGQEYRSRTDLVSVYATVTDKAGGLVLDLAKDDFEVRDNGKLQSLTYFSSDLQPITAVVMLDRSGSMEENFSLVRDAADHFIDRLLPADKARIGNFSGQILILPFEFTSSKDALKDVLRRDLQDIGPSPVWTAVDRSITALLKESGRRVVLLFSDGYDAPRPGQARTELRDAIRRSEINEVMVYSIGLAAPENPMAGWFRQSQVGRIEMGRRKPKIKKPDKGLRLLAEQSGGGYFELEWEQDMNAVFTRVADELHRQYALAFSPANLDGRVHKLEVKVRRSGLTARARRSYVAERR